MMGSLLYREVLLPRWHSAPEGTVARIPQEFWMGVYFGEERIGYVHSKETPQKVEEVEGALLEFTARFSLTLFERDTELFIDGATWRSYDAGLENFDFNIKSGSHAMQIEGVLENGLLDAKLLTAGVTQDFSIPVDEAIQLSFGLKAPEVDIEALKEGDELFVDTFDPTTMRVTKARMRFEKADTIEVGGRLRKCSVIATTMGGMTTHAWISEKGTVLRAETPFGFMLEKITRAQAFAPLPEQDKADMIQGLLVKATGETPVRNATEMEVRLHGVAERDLPADSPFQVKLKDSYLMRQPVLFKPKTFYIDKEYLKSDPLITSDHPRIKEKAQQIVWGSISRWDSAFKIYKWVHENIEKVPIISVPSALDVLRTREGDCNEHTVLFTALARAADVPTRIAIGLVWSDELSGFGYHAWPEVLMGDAWVPMDPTLGQIFADATHIRLFNGSIDQWHRLIPFLGQLEIEVLSVTPPEEEHP